MLQKILLKTCLRFGALRRRCPPGTFTHVFLYICVYTCTYIYIYLFNIYIYIYIHVLYVYGNIYRVFYTHTFFVDVHTYLRRSVCVYAHVFIDIYSYTYKTAAWVPEAQPDLS